MNILLCGSIAYDVLMFFPDRFNQHILPQELHRLNVAFLISEMRREFGGTAGNIAYNLNLLGDIPLIMATVGNDFPPYQDWLTRQKIQQTYISLIPDQFTAQAFITTDSTGNQLTAFHPGAMNFSHQNSIADISEPISLALISPDGKAGMMQHAKECFTHKIPFIFDPGQALPMFNAEELDYLIGMADYLALNAYEAELLKQKLACDTKYLADKVSALIITLGDKGSEIYTEDDCIAIPAESCAEAKDPTGCGDAYRAGLAYGIVRGWSWEKSGQLASKMGAIKIASQGGQNHILSDKQREGLG